MQIDINLLIAWGAIAKKYKKNETIFFEEDQATCYYQIQEGQVKMVNISNEGREYIQGIFNDGESFGEPPLFINETYPTSAVAALDSIVLKISKDKFMQLLHENPTLQFSLLKVLSQRIYNKSITAREIVNGKPEDVILAFLKSMKKRNGQLNGRFQVLFTRQEIANLTGLRVETVIRTLKNMEKNKLVEIIDHKLWY